MHNDNYVVRSLELHLFFGRIMKEHALFLKAGFTPANQAFSNKAEFFKERFENLLSRAIALSSGIISDEVLCSGELVTDFTDLAERQTEHFTGISINKNITKNELHLGSNRRRCCGNEAERHNQVQRLNREALKLLDGLIAFKETVLIKVNCCEMFTMNYPLLIEHIIREAKLYREYVCMLEKQGDLDIESMKEIECFWNQIMMEHALFIRGLLDPTEKELFKTADQFACEYANLLESCRNAQDCMLTDKSLEETENFKKFKTAGVQGIEQCKIRSLILPLLADHVLREANHYLRMLKAK